MVIANNAIRLKEIQSAVIEDNNVFGNIESVSIATIDRVLKRNEMHMKQLYKVPFERNGERVKEIRHQYVQLNMSSMYTLIFSTVNCFTLCSFMQYTSNSVYVFTEHTVHVVFQNGSCYT